MYIKTDTPTTDYKKNKGVLLVSNQCSHNLILHRYLFAELKKNTPEWLKKMNKTCSSLQITLKVLFILT